MDSQIDMKACERMVRSLSYRAMRRIPRASFLSREDLEQELWCALCKARDAFNPALGIPFGAYAYRGMLQHLNRYIEKHIWRFAEGTMALSLDAEMTTEDGSTATLGEAIASDAPPVIKGITEESNYKMALSRLSPRAQKFVAILHEQPEAIIREVMLGEDKLEHAKKIGAPYLPPKRITASLVFDLLGAGTTERRKILTEVEDMGMRMSR